MKKITLILALALCVALSGCKKQEAPASSQEPSQKPVVSSENTDSKQEESDITPYVENLEGPLGTAPVFGEDSEYAGHFVFRTDKDVKNFCFFKVEMTYAADDNRLVGTPVEEYGYLETLKANEEVLLMGDAGEVWPFLAVSFDGEDGTVYYYAIEVSGEDGHAFLTPFDLAE